MGQVTKGHLYPLSIRGVRLLCDIKTGLSQFCETSVKVTN